MKIAIFYSLFCISSSTDPTTRVQNSFVAVDDEAPFKTGSYGDSRKGQREGGVAGRWKRFDGAFIDGFEFALLQLCTKPDHR